VAKNNRPQAARKPAKKSVRASESSTYLNELNQAIMCQHNGQLERAADILQRVLALDSNHVEANFTLGLIFHQVNRSDLAIPLLQKAASLRPKLFEAALNLGIVLRAAGKLDAARVELERAVALKPTSSKAHVTLGLLMIDRNTIDEAERLFRKAVALNPRNGEAHAQLGLIHKTRGEREQALVCYRRAVALNPQYAEAHRGLAYLRTYTEYDKDIELMEQVYRDPTTPENERLLLGFSLGKVFDDLKRYDEAFEYLAEGNRLKRKTYNFSIPRSAELFEHSKRVLNRDFVERHRERAPQDATPIFVLGMPRSGTSLVEQILASHPAVHGAGEVDFLRTVTDEAERLTGKPFPAGVDALPPGALSSAAQSYLAKLKAGAGGAAHVTDKLPHNFLRVGLIQAVLPNAKIIHCDRDALDNCLSIFQHHFSGHHGYASNLEELGQYYRLYQDLMTFWHEQLPERIYRLNYERLTTDTEAEVRALLEYCNLPFHSDCLQFHKTERLVNTPSATQVREPMYRNSVARWKNYARHLQPLQQALAGDIGAGAPQPANP
jgi:tetratricopeptide (TPR) repeat protein